MNMRWAWTLPVLSALTATSIANSAWAQGGAPAPLGAAPTAMQPYAPAMMPQGMMPQGMYAPAAAYPPAMYAGGPPAYPAAPPGAAAPDVYGSYGYMPVDFASQPHAPPGYGGANYAQAMYGQPGPAPGGYGPPGYGPPPSGMMDQQGYGGYGPQMGSYGQPMDGQMGPGAIGPGGMGGMGGGMDGGCPYCGGQGCQQCGGGQGGNGTWMPNGLLGDVLGLVAPYPDGGCAAPRWYDFAVDYMMLKRDNTGRSDQIFATQGAGLINPVLNANQLNFGGYKPGFRFSAALQIAAANSLEFTYFGLFNYNAHAQARSGNSSLFSPFSNFGLNPLGGFSEFDQADFARIGYQSTFDSFEINWRCRWMAPNCRYQGSWTVGVRNFILDEKLRYASSSSVNGFPGPTVPAFIPAMARVDTDTTNTLTGIQFGSDMWLCLLPGLRAGGELQAGVYGNHMNINRTVGSNLVPPTAFAQERMQANDVSFIGQANLLMTYRINYQWSLRAGYQFLYVNGVALATENFNPTPPLLNDPFRRPTHVNTNGSVFYHGWNVGLEYMW